MCTKVAKAQMGTQSQRKKRKKVKRKIKKSNKTKSKELSLPLHHCSPIVKLLTFLEEMRSSKSARFKLDNEFWIFFLGVNSRLGLKSQEK